MKSLSDLFSERKWLVYALLVLAPVLVYLKGITYPFSPMDEQWLIVNDAAFLEKWSFLFSAFKDSIQGIYYRPVFTGSLVLDYHISALNPLMYHITNLLFHVLATLLLFRLLILLKAEKRAAALLCLLFSVHPVLVHAVEWIPGRNDSMLCVFSLLAIIHLVRYLTGHKPGHAFLHLLFFALALLTKENAIVLPLIFVLFFFIYSRLSKQLVALLCCWLAALAAWYYLRNSAVDYFPAGNGHFIQNLKEFFTGLLIFTGKAVFPVRQSVAPTPANSSLIPGLAALALLVFLYYKPGVKNKKIAGVGIAVFIVLLIIPVWYGALSPLGEQYEHRIYTSLTGLIIFASQLNFKPKSKWAGYIILGVSVVFAAKTVSRISVYHDDLSYLNEGVADCPENYIFHSQTANIFYLRHELHPALDAYNKAIRLQPSRSQLYQNRGNVYLGLSKKKEALDDYTTSLKLSNNNSVVLLTRCVAYNSFGDTDSAMSDLRALEKCCKDIVPQQLEREISVKWLNRQFKIINAALLKEPGNAALYVNRAQLYFNQRMGNEALSDLKKACELDPGNAKYKAYYNKLKSTYKH